MHEVIATDKAPKAIGPYSQATREAATLGRLVFCSGQIPIVPETGELVGPDIRQQTRRVLANLEAVLDAAGCRMRDVVKTTVYLKSLAEFQAMNEEYAKFFAESPPARATVEVSRLPKDVGVEIDCIAIRGA